MKIKEYNLILLVSFFMLLFDNVSFFRNVTSIFPVISHNIGFLISLALGLTAVTVFVFTLVCNRYTTKPVLITVLVISAAANYFMNNYSVIINDDMIRNIVQTNYNEATDLFSMKLVVYIVFLGLLPATFVYKTKIEYNSMAKELFAKTMVLGVTLLLLLGMVFTFSRYYTSFFREHKPLRYYTNPTYWIYSTGEFAVKTLTNHKIITSVIGADASIVEKDHKKELVIMVVGEAARADRFSLNGYSRETNPLLQQEEIINFPRFYSCDTSTATSVPCMFSSYGRDEFTINKALAQENVLDVLQHAGVQILWRDNNSDSKAVALRIPHEDFKNPRNNPVCDVECRDEGMLTGLEQYVEQNRDQDMLIVLHQMGNHGPAYYKRYPKSFEKFTPVCRTNLIEECSKEEINNAYDNAILYTDYFLAKVIKFLKKYDGSYETAMIYMSDHGESLGENRIYLHGLPYFLAPDHQIHVGAFMWIGETIRHENEIDFHALKERADNTYSHDNLFSTLLGIFEVRTKYYDRNKDILHTEGSEQKVAEKS